MPKRKTQVDLAATIRQAIADSGLSYYELARMSGVDRGRIGRHARGERTLGLDGASKLCQVLGLDLVQVRKSEGE